MSFFSELKRRNVFRVAIAYLAAAWLLTEIADTLFPAFGIPDWAFRFVVLALGLGFVLALVFSWAYELTPEGLKREKDVVRDASITHSTARRLDLISHPGAGVRRRRPVVARFADGKRATCPS